MLEQRIRDCQRGARIAVSNRHSATNRHRSGFGVRIGASGSVSLLPRNAAAQKGSNPSSPRKSVTSGPFTANTGGGDPQRPPWRPYFATASSLQCGQVLTRCIHRLLPLWWLPDHKRLDMPRLQLWEAQPAAAQEYYQPRHFG